MLRRVHSLQLSITLVTSLAVPLSGCGRDAMFALERPDTGDLLDGGLPDGFVPDGDLPDGFVPDGFVPDGFVPDTGLPDAVVPDFGVPDGGPPDVVIPDFGVPDTGLPDAVVPDFGVPDTGLPDAVVPDFGVPDAGFPDAFVPDLGTPDVGIPDVVIPDVGIPDVVIPDFGVPDSGVPDAFVPDSGINCPNGCDFLDDDCNVGVCAPDGVTCVRVPRPPGTTCDDGDACTTGSLCRAGRCLPGAPVDCSALDDACNLGSCAPTTGQCVANPLPNNTPCDDGVDCTDSSCQTGTCVGTPVPPPLGDTCLTSVPIIIAPGAQTQSGSNVCATDANNGSCGFGSGGTDIIYESTFTETRRIRLETVPPSTGGSQYDTVVYANDGVCTMQPTPNPRICDDDMGSGFLSLVDTVFPGGTWFFTVDGFGSFSRGDHELLIEVDPHDTCARPSVITIPNLNQTNTFAGNTSGNANDFTANCGGSQASPDQVWTFQLQQRSSLRFETVAPPFGRYDTALHVRSSTCAAGGAAGVIACDDDGGQGTFSRIERSFDPGTYFLIVDGFGANQSGEYRLEVTQLTPLTPIIFPATGDARQPLSGVFSSAGEFVEGIRTVTGNQISRMEINLQVNNALTCGAAFFRVRLNNTQVGTFIVRPGDTSLSQNLTFNPVFGANGRFNVRYELQANIQPNCGTVSLPDNVSTVGLGN